MSRKHVYAPVGATKLLIVEDDDTDESDNGGYTDKEPATAVHVDEFGEVTTTVTL